VFWRKAIDALVNANGPPSKQRLLTKPEGTHHNDSAPGHAARDQLRGVSWEKRRSRFICSAPAAVLMKSEPSKNRCCRCDLEVIICRRPKACCCGSLPLPKRSPAPPPYSSMNWIPGLSRVTGFVSAHHALAPALSDPCSRCRHRRQR
jgi:hypothetical protein